MKVPNEGIASIVKRLAGFDTKRDQNKMRDWADSLRARIFKTIQRYLTTGKNVEGTW